MGACVVTMKKFVIGRFRMKRTLMIGATLAAAFALSQPVLADTLAKIKSSGSIAMGVRESSGNLSFAMADGKYSGYHVELCERVISDIRRQLRLNRLNVVYRPVTSLNRIPLLQNGTIDIECGSTTNNITRQRDVAFAVTTFVEEVRIAVKANSAINSVADLKNHTVVSTAGTTSVQNIRKHKRAANISFKEVQGRDHADSFRLLESGQADAFVMDSQILVALMAKSKNPADCKMVGEVLSVEPIAIMVRKDDAAFKKAVDDSLKALMKSGEIANVYGRHFIQSAPTPLLASEATKAAWTTPTDKPVEAYVNK
jgi:glutamate/aspartate transport system substrate-binding protein